MGSFVHAIAIGSVCPFTTFFTSTISEKLCATNSRASSYFCQGSGLGQDRTCEMYLCQSTTQYICAPRVSFLLPAKDFEHCQFRLPYLQVYERKTFQKIHYHFKYKSKTVKLPVLASLAGWIFVMEDSGSLFFSSTELTQSGLKLSQ